MLNIKRISNSRTNDLIAVLIASCELRLSQSQELQFRDAFLLWSSHWKMFQRVTLKNSHNFDKCQSAKRLALLFKTTQTIGGYTILRLPFGHAAGNDLIFAKLQPLKRHAKHASLFLHWSSFFTTQSSLFWPNGWYLVEIWVRFSRFCCYFYSWKNKGLKRLKNTRHITIQPDLWKMTI